MFLYLFYEQKYNCFIFFRKQLLDERSRFSEEIKNTNRCEKELISYRAQLDTVTKRKVYSK